jgi:hypothetical protein
MHSFERTWAASTDVPAMEHRWGVRKSCRIRVRILVDDKELATARLRDVSLTGAFLEAAASMPLLGRFELATIPDEARSPHETRIYASVVRHAHDGVGVEWCEPAAGSICALLGCKTRCTEAPCLDAPRVPRSPP